MSASRQASIGKAVDGAMLLAFYGYLRRDQSLIDTANVGLRECGYPLLRPIVVHGGVEGAVS